MINKAPIARSFLFKGTTLPYPDPALSPKQVAQRYAHQFPELVSAEPLPAKIVNGVEVTEFRENFGTKG